MKDIIIYTDGACKIDGTGGWCFIVTQNDKELKLGWGAEDDTTNNRMELFACIKALDYCNENNIQKVTIITDSQYVIGMASKGWKRNTNKDILDRLDKSLSKINIIEWKHVKGHAGNKWNERCDAFASTASNYNK